MTHMRSIVSTIPLSLAIGVAILWALPQGQTSTRSVFRSTNRPIASLLTAKDIDVTVVSRDSPGLVVKAPPGKTEIEWQTERADAVLVIRITEKYSHLTPEGDWITTTVHGVADQILKTSAKVIFGQGQEVVFDVAGGETDIQVADKTVRVRGVVPWAVPFEKGSTYLIFIWSRNDGSLLVTPQLSYEITDDGSLMSLERMAPGDELNQARAFDVVDKIRRVR